MFAASGKTTGGSGGHTSRSGSRSHKGSDQKTTRIRTVLNEKQLHTLRTCYGANPRPDALMKEQLVEMTGLSPRVIRVWFQNKRCKDKKRSILMKQLQLQQQQQQQHQHQDKVVVNVPISAYVNRYVIFGVNIFFQFTFVSAIFSSRTPEGYFYPNFCQK